jgi:hypothetical protein
MFFKCRSYTALPETGVFGCTAPKLISLLKPLTDGSMENNGLITI